MVYIELTSQNPAYNLAVEEILFNELKPADPGYFLLWQNSPSIIIGRHQVTEEVINTEFIKKYSLPVIRRMTGGGAVYHDLGNLNFSFITHASPNRQINFQTFLKPVRDALLKFGIKASLSGRNDLEVEGRKISGSGQLREKEKVLHHGTLLYNVNREMMSNALRTQPDKLHSKGVQSHKGRTANLVDIAQSNFSLEELKAALIEKCADKKGEVDAVYQKAAIELVKNKYDSWIWNYGKSPECDVLRKKRFPWGEVSIKLQTTHGIIRDCQIRGDFFSNGNMTDLENLFKDISFLPENIAFILAKENLAYWFNGCDPDAMRDYFVKELFL